MAKTIFDMPAPRAKIVPRLLVQGAPDEPEAKKIPSQAEEGEPEVECEPKLGREVFSYLEPRKGIDAPGDFRSCASCYNFIPERAFHGAASGNRCKLFGTFPVMPHANCSRYVPWPMGKPVEAAIEHHALASLNAVRGSISPWDACYCEDKKHSHKCRDCRHYDSSGDPDEPGPECEFFEELNRSASELFMISEKVDPDGGCSAFGEPVPTDANPSGQEGPINRSY